MADLNAVRPEPVDETPTAAALAEEAALSERKEKLWDALVRSESQKIKLRWVGTALAMLALTLLALLEVVLLCQILWHDGHAEALAQLAFAPIVAFTAIVAVFLLAVFRPPRARDLDQLPAGRAARVVSDRMG